MAAFSTPSTAIRFGSRLAVVTPFRQRLRAEAEQYEVLLVDD
jgi:hypothetical protein